MVDEKSFHDFGENWDGDIFDFVQRYYRVSLPEAIKIIKSDFGLLDTYSYSEEYKKYLKQKREQEQRAKEGLDKWFDEEFRSINNQLDQWGEIQRTAKQYTLGLAYNNIERLEYIWEVFFEAVGNSEKKLEIYRSMRQVIDLQSFTDREMTELGQIKREALTPKTYYKFSSFEYKTSGKERVLSGIEHLDYLTSGFEMGCITIWTGQTNAGKTTVMTMLIKQTIMQGEKVFFFNGEQTKDDFKNNLYKQTVEAKYIKPKQYKESCVFDFYVDDYQQIEKLNRIYGENLYIYNNEMPRNINFLLDAMEEVRVKDKVRVFILDNFMQIDTTSSDEYREQKQIMEQLRTFAVNKNVHIHLVAHPRKMDRDNTRITIYDVLGSSNLVYKAYNAFVEGGQGAVELANLVVKTIEENPSKDLNFAYTDEDEVKDKVCKVACNLYGANLVTFSPTAKKKLAMIQELGYTHFPICIAKTQYSFSTNAKLINVPKDFEFHVQDIVINAGAEMLVVISGEIMRMPGLPKNPQALHIDIVNGEIEGLS